MDNNRTVASRKALLPSGGLAQGVADEPQEIGTHLYSNVELLTFLEDYDGQLATVVPMYRVFPRRIDRIKQAIARSLKYIGRALTDLPDMQ